MSCRPRTATHRSSATTFSRWFPIRSKRANRCFKILLIRRKCYISICMVNHCISVSEPYARIRRQQYIGFVIIMFGLLLQWPTILTIMMFPIIVWMYTRLARIEDRNAEKQFSKTWSCAFQPYTGLHSASQIKTCECTLKIILQKSPRKFYQKVICQTPSQNQFFMGLSQA